MVTLVSARSESVFTEALELLAEKNSSLHKYFVDNWLPHVDAFVPYHFLGVRTLNNRTNNRLERFHNTLKGTLSTSRLSVTGLVTVLLTLADVRSMEDVHRNFRASIKKPLNPTSEVAESYASLFTPYSCSLISDELQKASKKLYTITQVDQQVEVYSFDTQVVYTVSAGKDSCTCGLLDIIGLPCRHIFAVLLDGQEQTFQPNLIAPRWNLQKPTIAAEGQSSQREIVPSLQPNTTRTQRFTTAVVITREINSFIADQPFVEFQKYVRCLELIKDNIVIGNVEKLTECLLNINNQPQPSSVDTGTNGLPDDSLVQSELLPPNLSELDQPRTEIRSLNVNFKSVTKCKGRPPTGKKPFVVFGSRKRYVARKDSNENSSSAALGRAPGSTRDTSPQPKKRKVVAGRPDTAKRSTVTMGLEPIKRVASLRCTKRTVGAGNVNDNCAECGLPDPVNDSASTVRWVECTKCTFWYHQSCVGGSISRTRSYICARCLAV